MLNNKTHGSNAQNIVNEIGDVRDRVIATDALLNRLERDAPHTKAELDPIRERINAATRNPYGGPAATGGGIGQSYGQVITSAYIKALEIGADVYGDEWQSISDEMDLPPSPISYGPGMSLSFREKYHGGIEQAEGESWKRDSDVMEHITKKGKSPKGAEGYLHTIIRADSPTGFESITGFTKREGAGGPMTYAKKQKAIPIRRTGRGGHDFKMTRKRR